MKTITLDTQHTETDCAAYRADGPISLAVASHFYTLYAKRPESAGMAVDIRNSIIYISTTKPPRGFPEFILELLTQADRFVTHAQEAERRKYEVALAQNRELLKRIPEGASLSAPLARHNSKRVRRDFTPAGCRPIHQLHGSSVALPVPPRGGVRG